MNIGVIFAGGAGTRMNTKSRPKQFLELGGKPLSMVTLEVYEYHPALGWVVSFSLHFFMQERPLSSISTMALWEFRVALIALWQEHRKVFI